ncbi:MAG: hypothetical protein RIR97_238 [Pseudomonadota bacterium]
MDGFGFGNHWRYGTRSTFETSSRIEIPLCSKAGFLNTGTRAALI